MSDFTKENISDLLFQNVDSIVIVDAQKGSYQAVKRTGLFEKIIQDTGSYNDLLKRLWFNINIVQTKFLWIIKFLFQCLGNSVENIQIKSTFFTKM